MSDMLVHPDALPAAQGSAPRVVRRPPGMPPLPPKNTVKQRVLVVESDTDCARLIEFVLNLQGYEVTTASDLTSATEMVSNQSFGQIIMDVSLPDGSGLELLELVRKQMNLTIPVIVVSGLRQHKVNEDCMAAGATEFVTKPFSPSELVMRLGKWTRN